MFIRKCLYFFPDDTYEMDYEALFVYMELVESNME